MERQRNPGFVAPIPSLLPLPADGQRVGVRGGELRKREQNCRLDLHNGLNWVQVDPFNFFLASVVVNVLLQSQT